MLPSAMKTATPWMVSAKYLAFVAKYLVLSALPKSQMTPNPEASRFHCRKHWHLTACPAPESNMLSTTYNSIVATFAALQDHALHLYESHEASKLNVEPDGEQKSILSADRWPWTWSSKKGSGWIVHGLSVLFLLPYLGNTLWITRVAVLSFFAAFILENNKQLNKIVQLKVLVLCKILNKLASSISGKRYL